MLSVHRHCHSWNVRANELREGRWVQGPAEFEPANLGTPVSPSPPPPPRGEQRSSASTLRGILNSSAPSCAPNKLPHCGREAFGFGDSREKKGSGITNGEINVHVALHGAAELAADCREERRPELLTPADPNPP